MIKKLTLSLVTALTLTSTSALAEKVYATVDGEKVTDEDIKTVLRNPEVKFSTLPDDTKKQIINQMIEKKLLTIKAIQSDIRTSKQYKDAIAKLEKDLALEVWMQREFKKIKITDAQIKDFYNKNSEKFKKGEQLKARHILVENEKDANAIIKELNNAKDKKAKFIELAKSKSTGPSGARGGDLGWFDERQMVPEFSKAASALKKDSYSKKPVKTQFGHHIIYLEDKKSSSKVTLEEASNKIKQILLQEQFRLNIKSISDKLRKTSKIVIN